MSTRVWLKEYINMFIENNFNKEEIKDNDINNIINDIMNNDYLWQVIDSEIINTIESYGFEYN